MSSAFEKLLAAVNVAKSNKTERADDAYFYYPARDASGNGSATIRFLPGKNEDEIPFVKMYKHQFKGPTNKWLIDNCLTTIGNDCPVCAANSKNYDTMSKDDARKLGMNRKVEYIARILVVDDKSNPENVGKTFLYKFGTKVFAKISDAMSPAFEDEDPINPFSLEEGANFKLRITKEDGQTSYAKSAFDKVSACKLKPEYTDENDIGSFITPDKFKTVEELEKRLELALGNTRRVKKEESEDDEEFDTPKPTKPKVRKEVVESDDEDDEMLAMMRKLAEED